MLPLVVGHCQLDDDELREHCLQALEAFVHKCPKEVTPHIGTVRREEPTAWWVDWCVMSESVIMV